MISNKPILTFEDVAFAYEGSTSNALDGVSLDVYEGEFICILGGNGSGKTTLSKLTNALLFPKSGRVTTCGLDTANPDNVSEIRQNVGMVFQNPDDQMIGNSIEDDVAFGPENLCLPSDEIQSRVKIALKQVGLQGFAQHETQSLSGGQKQRVAIAGALAMNSKVLVLDEAGSMLDPRGRSGLLKACKKLNDDGLTIIYVTHFLDEAVAADRIVVMQNGKIADIGKPSEVLEDQAMLDKLRLDAPYTVTACAELKVKGVPVRTHLYPSGLVDDLHELGFSNDAALTASQLASEMTTKEENSKSAPIIKLENVSYSYLEKKILKKTLVSQKATGLRKFNNESSEKTKWGAEPSSIWALNNLSITINKGDFFGIIGHTGSGKSTLLRILAGLIRPNIGDVFIKGINLASKKGKNAIRETLGIVMQYPEKQLFAQTVFEDCAFGPRNLGLSEKEVDERVEFALNLMGVDESLFEKSPFELSGGQQRRVAIAGVLAMRPQILILDEPTAGLDPVGCKSLLELIKKMHDENGVTVLMVSHNMNSIAYLCNRVLVLNKGTEFMQGSPIEVFTSENRLRKIGLGLPSTIDLARELNISGFNNVPKIEQLTTIIAESMHGRHSEAHALNVSYEHEGLKYE